MISYPLREYISSKKDDDYYRSFSKTNSSIENCNEKTSSNRSIYLCLSIVFILIVLSLYLFSPSTDPTCFKEECLQFVCKAYEEGLIAGHLCPDLCTSKSLQLGNCLGEHRHFRSRLFESNEGNELIRCYLKSPLSQSNPSFDVHQTFEYPPEGLTLQSFAQALNQLIQGKIDLNDPERFVEDLLRFADFNKDEKISLAEGRSVWSLIQIDEFVNTFLFSSKSYMPQIVGTCGHLFALEKVFSPQLPLNEKKELKSDRPNWFQRVRMSIGIIEFVEDILHFEDRNEHFYLCQFLHRSFGYDKDFEAKFLKSNSLTSSKSSLATLPRVCHSNEDCLSDCSFSYSYCNESVHQCQLKRDSSSIFKELCSLLSLLLLPDGNSTFIQTLTISLHQCEQIVLDGQFSSHHSFNFISFQIRQTILLQNLKNLLWSNIEYQMGKITKRSTKKPSAPPPIHSIK